MRPLRWKGRFRTGNTSADRRNRAFVDCLLGDAPPPIDHVDGLMATLMVLQAFKSIHSGQPEPVASVAREWLQGR